MNRRYLQFVFILVLIAAALAFIWFGILKTTDDGDLTPHESGDSQAHDALAPLAGEGAKRPGNEPPAPGDEDAPASPAPAPAVAGEFASGTLLHDALLEAETALQGGVSRFEAVEVIKRLRAALGAAPPAEASAAIRDYLASGRDASTRIPFTVGPGGELLFAPSMRTALLDVLAQIDPQEALRQAERVFDLKTSADEYAISLRNVARLGGDDAASHDYVARRTRELLGYAEWAEAPSAGFAEAFDAVVYTRDLDALPLLSNFAAEGAGRELNHPAFMTLDRLVLAEPARTLEELSNSEELLGDRPLMRAGFFARADPADAQQVGLAREFLLDQPASSETAQYFLSLFPNLNFVVSDNLLTQPTAYGHDEVVRRLQGALDVVQEWRSDPAMADYAAQLDAAARRIREQLGEE